MPSRLSSLLVRDGLVGVKRMEKAFQRQVIYGGSLDTILLEMGLVPEDRLTQYLALASGLPPARFTTLARTLDADPAAPPVGRAPTIIVDSGPPVAMPSVAELTRQAATVHAGAGRLAPVPSDAQTLRLMGPEPLPLLHPDDA